MKRPSVILRIFTGISLAAALLAYGCGTYVSPCYEGTSRCNNNILQTCDREAWVDSVKCARCSTNTYECGTGACCMAL